MKIRPYQESDFPAIQKLYKDEGWKIVIERKNEMKQAIQNSQIALVVIKNNKLIGFLRGLTDTKITTYIAEIIVHKDDRKNKIGTQLIEYCHELYPQTRIDLLATQQSASYYQNHNFRPFYGFRKNK